MRTDRRVLRDPRTVARDIPGIFEALLPQLVPGIVAHFNRRSRAIEGCEQVFTDVVGTSQLQHAMLFELAVAAAEQLLDGLSDVDWNACLSVAVNRQRRYFDAQVPDALSADDINVARLVANNLVVALRQMQRAKGGVDLVREPHIPGYRWIASGKGDFSVADNIVEVKCTARRFSTSDYRQVVMYWLLSYVSSLQTATPEWVSATLINPRLNYVTEFSFDELLAVIGGGRSKLDLLDQFSALVAEDEV